MYIPFELNCFGGADIALILRSGLILGKLGRAVSTTILPTLESAKKQSSFETVRLKRKSNHAKILSITSHMFCCMDLQDRDSGI